MHGIEPLVAARRPLAVLGAVAAMLVTSGTAAVAKSDITMNANHPTVKAGRSIRFTGHFDDDNAGGVNDDQICLWQYVEGNPVRQVAPCVALHQQNGDPLPPDSVDGYFTVSVKVSAPGRLVVVPVVKTSYDRKAVYQYAQVTIVVARAAWRLPR